MGKLTEAHLEQIRNMKDDGKKYREIRDFFMQTYKIKLYDSTIAKTCKGHTTLPVKTKRKYSKGSKQTGTCLCQFGVICRFKEICKPEICKFKEG